MNERLFREPLIHFVLLGALLFGIDRYLADRTQASRITVSKNRIARLADHYRQQYGTPPSPLQLDTLVENSVTEEIFYREALRLGLDRDDEIVRRRLVQKYEFLRQDLATPPEPTDAQLARFYQEHRDAYRIPERVTFTHVYFSPDQRGELGANQAAGRLAASLNRQSITRATDQGDRYPGPYDFARLSRDELVRAFGREGLSQMIFNVGLNRWSPPLRSGFGWHTVYVTALEAARQADLEEVRERLRGDYLEEQRKQRNAASLAKLRTLYQVVRE